MTDAWNDSFQPYTAQAVAASFIIWTKVKCLSLSVCMCACCWWRVFYHNYPLDVVFLFWTLELWVIFHRKANIKSLYSPHRFPSDKSGPRFTLEILKVLKSFLLHKHCYSDLNSSPVTSGKRYISCFTMTGKMLLVDILKE